VANWDDGYRAPLKGVSNVEEFTDIDAEQLLHLLHRYVTTYTPDLPQTIPAMAEDLAMSMDETTDLADKCRREIEQAYYA